MLVEGLANSNSILDRRHGLQPGTSHILSRLVSTELLVVVPQFGEFCDQANHAFKDSVMRARFTKTLEEKMVALQNIGLISSNHELFSKAQAIAGLPSGDQENEIAAYAALLRKKMQTAGLSEDDLERKSHSRYTSIFKRLETVNNSAAPHWKETEKRFVGTSPFRAQIQEVEVEHGLSDETLDCLRAKVKFNIWYSLTKSNNTAGLLTSDQQVKLEEIDRFIKSVGSSFS